MNTVNEFDFLTPYTINTSYGAVNSNLGAVVAQCANAVCVYDIAASLDLRMDVLDDTKDFEDVTNRFLEATTPLKKHALELVIAQEAIPGTWISDTSFVPGVYKRDAQYINGKCVQTWL